MTRHPVINPETNIRERELESDPDTGKIYARWWTSKGERVLRFTGVVGQVPPTLKDIQKAHRKLNDIKETLKDQLEPRSLESARLVRDEWPRWFDTCSPLWEQPMPTDVKSKAENHILPFFGSLDVRQITNNKWKEFYNHFQKTPPRCSTHHSRPMTFDGYHWVCGQPVASPKKKPRYCSRTYPKIRSTKHIRCYLLMFLNFMSAEVDEQGRKFLPVVPDLEEFNKADDTPGRPLTASEEDAIERVLVKKDLSTRLKFYLGRLQGPRPGKEIHHIRKEWIDLEVDIINYPKWAHKGGKKTKKERPMPIHPELKGLLIQQMKAHPDSPWLFPSPKDPMKPQRADGFRAWTRLKKSAGITKRLRRHDLRVTRATDFAVQGLPMALTGALLGMSPKILEKHYQKIQLKHLKDVYKKDVSTRKQAKKSRIDGVKK